MSPLRACVIGMGPIGNTHAQVYQEGAGVELIGVCDIREDRAKAGETRFGVPGFTDAQTMLRQLKPDICSVATGGFEYASDHYLPTLQALRAGCHVLTEKPICNDLAKAREMVEEARRLQRCFAIDLNHRFTPAARHAKRWQQEGRLGDLLFANMALWIGKPGEFETDVYHLKALNPHSVDILRYFMGEVEQVHCYAMKAPGRSLWSTASINLRFENGAVGHLTSSYDIARGHPMERCEVAGVKGRLVVEDMWREATLYPAGEGVKSVYTNPVFGGFRDFYDTFADRIMAFVGEVAAGTPPESIDGSGKDGLAASRVIHGAIQSLREGRPIDIRDVWE